MEIITKHVKPLVKKSSTYAILSIPLILFSLTNLFILLINHGFNRDMWLTLLVFAILAAIGMAFSKESKSLQKEIQQKSNHYIIERIKKSSLFQNLKRKNLLISLKSNQY